MTWAEFRLRLLAYKRQEKNKVLMLRELAWITYIAPHQDRKRLKKTKQSFWPIEKEKKKKNSDEAEKMRKRIKDAQQKFLDEQKKLKDAGD